MVKIVLGIDIENTTNIYKLTMCNLYSNGNVLVNTYACCFGCDMRYKL